jgi:hypothetical protein
VKGKENEIKVLIFGEKGVVFVFTGELKTNVKHAY